MLLIHSKKLKNQSVSQKLRTCQIYLNYIKKYFYVKGDSNLIEFSEVSYRLPLVVSG